MLLAIDTSTSLVGAACLSEAEVLSEITVADARRHGELLAPTIQRALAGSGRNLRDLDQIVVGVGPGPFTGLRVGITTGLVMGHALGIPVVGVCSLDGLAKQSLDTLAMPRQWPEFIVATDARRTEVYWARYVVLDGVMSRIGPPRVGKAADLPVDIRALPTVGRGPLLYPDALSASGGPLDVSPAALGALAFDEAHTLAPEPLYLRRPDAVPTVKAAGFAGAGAE